MAITQTDIENVYGANNVAQWSTFLGGTQATSNATRVAVAIAFASASVESLLRNGPYAVPIVNGDGSGDEVPEILNAKATLAGYWLWQTRGLNQAKETVAEMNAQRAYVLKQLREIRTGMLPINASFAANRTSTPFVV